MKNPLKILKTHWGYESFRPLQAEIIQHVLQGKDTVALLPTGGGKSICFQVPAMAMDGICIVVSPLIALMNNQTNRLNQMGIKSIALTGSLTYDDLNRLLENAIFGNYKFLYLSPERLQQPIVQTRIAQMPVNLIAVDEAHCISQWGNDFRPAYKNLTFLREIFPQIPLIALTATATPEVLTDTCLELKLDNPGVFKQSFYRENLAYNTQKAEDKLYAIEQLLAKDESAIIYTRNRKRTETLSRELNIRNYQADFFHGGISEPEKREKLHHWLSEKIKVMVATNAFGMGIDKSNVRKVIHYEMPESIESYFQEAGRAGRDGKPSKTVLLYNESDFRSLKEQHIDRLPTADSLKTIYRKLCNFFYIAYGEGAYTTHAFNFEKFCLQYNLPTTQTFHQINALDRLGIISLSMEYGQKSHIQFLIGSEELIQYLEKHITTALVGKTILRIYSGIFDSPIPIDLEIVAAKSNQTVHTVLEVLKKFAQDQVALVQIATTDSSITFNERREDNRTINRVNNILKKQNEVKVKQVHAIINYVANQKECKNVLLLRYFGETQYKKCGICNVCIREKELPDTNDKNTIADIIIQLLQENTAMSSREICEKTNFASDKVLFVIQQLLDLRKIKMDTQNRYLIV